MKDRIIGNREQLAIKVLVFLANSRDEKRPMNVTEIADWCEASPSYLEQVLADLRKAGFVRSYRGPGGGYRLRLAPDEIKIGAVFKATVPPKHRGREKCRIAEWLDEVIYIALVNKTLDQVKA